MGINPAILTWLWQVADQKIFDGKSSILELGPQDHSFTKTKFAEIVNNLKKTSVAADMLADRIFDGNLSFPERALSFYSAFGFSEYRSLDHYDPRADWKVDLNTAERAPKKMDVIADFGTAEHVFNSGNVFFFMHNSVAPGGLMMHCLPTLGDNMHGFFNLHPTIYFDLARTNGYNILNFTYINDMQDRSRIAEQVPLADNPPSFLPLEDTRTQLRSFDGCAQLHHQLAAQYLKTLKRSEAENGLVPHSAVDYCFVVLQKTTDAPFVIPGQGIYKGA